MTRAELIKYSKGEIPPGITTYINQLKVQQNLKGKLKTLEDCKNYYRSKKQEIETIDGVFGQEHLIACRFILQMYNHVKDYPRKKENGDVGQNVGGSDSGGELKSPVQLAKKQKVNHQDSQVDSENKDEETGQEKNNLFSTEN